MAAFACTSESSSEDSEEDSWRELESTVQNTVLASSALHDKLTTPSTTITTPSSLHSTRNYEDGEK